MYKKAKSYGGKVRKENCLLWAYMPDNCAVSMLMISCNPSINPEREPCQLRPLLGKARQFAQAHRAVARDKTRIQTQT